VVTGWRAAGAGVAAASSTTSAAGSTAIGAGTGAATGAATGATAADRKSGSEVRVSAMRARAKLSSESRNTLSAFGTGEAIFAE
jgi:hypothetical protein